MPFIMGSTTPIAALVATAASIAFPPRARICAPACAARGLSAATIPYRVIVMERAWERSCARAELAANLSHWKKSNGSNGKYSAFPVLTIPGAHGFSLGGSGDNVVFEGPLAQAALDGRPPAAITEPRERPAAVSPGILWDFAHRPGRVWGHLLDLELQRGGAQMSGGQFDQRRVWRSGKAW